MNDGYHEKRSDNRRKEDSHKLTLLKAVELALRLKTVESIHEVLKFAIEAVEL